MTRGNIAATKCLLEAGANINGLHSKEPTDVTVIVRAVDNIDLPMVKLLLKYKPDLTVTASECVLTLPRRVHPTLQIDWRIGLSLKDRRLHCQRPFTHAIQRLNTSSLWEKWFFEHQKRFLHRRIDLEEKNLKQIRDNLILIVRLLLKHGADTSHVLDFHKESIDYWLSYIEPGCFPLLLIETYCQYIPDENCKCSNPHPLCYIFIHH